MPDRREPDPTEAVPAVERVATCAWCGATFALVSRRGPTPRYCRAAHRQRAHEARRRPTNAVLSALRTLGAVRAGLGDSIDVRLGEAIDSALAAAGIAVTPAPVPVPNPSHDKSPVVAPTRTRPTQPAPWKAVRYRSGDDPTVRVAWIYGAHTTERAARSTLRRAEAAFDRAHTWEQNREWEWTVIHDAIGRFTNPSQ